MTSRSQRKVITSGWIVALSIIGPAAAHAQDTSWHQANVSLRRRAADGYEVVIDGDTMRAITTNTMQVLLKQASDLKALQNDLDIAQSILPSYDRTVKACMSAHAIDADVIRLQGEQIDDYKSLAKRLETIQNPWLTWQAGVGRDAVGPAVVAGLGLKQLRGWITAQDGRTAWFLGWGGRVF
jgi:hypothetical protein